MNNRNPERQTLNADENDGHLCRNRQLPGVLKDRARELRKQQTHAEAILWSLLRNNQLGLKFRRQYTIGRLILDFYSHKLHLGIELDGSIHHQPDMHARDEYKTEMIEGQGITLLRFANDDVLVNATGTLERIMEVARKLDTHPHPQPLPPRRGEY